MAMWTCVIKNSSGSDQLIEDLGITIPDADQETLSDQFTYDELAGSDDLRALVNAGDLVVNDGSSDLSAANGEIYLTFIHQKYLEDNHWTKSELAATGGSNDKIDWSQVQNAPSIGSVTWSDPVLYRVTAIQSSQPGAPNTGDVYVDTDDDHYYKYNGATWDDLGAAATDDLVINLANAQEDIYKFDGADFQEQSQSADNEARLVQDDGDGKQAQYVYNGTAAEWKKIGDVDFGDHLDDLAARHNDDQIQVELAYTNLGSSANDGLDDVLADIDTEVGANATAASNAQSAADAAQSDATQALSDAAAAQSDIDDHVDGTASKHDASEIDVEGQGTDPKTDYPNIALPAWPSGDVDLETVIDGIDAAVGGITPGGTLDEAYDHGGAGAGRTVNVDNGAVKLSASGGYAPLELGTLGSAPNTDLQAGQVAVINNELYVYDGGRSKWLSVLRHTFAFGKRGRARDQYLQFYTGNLRSNNTGLRLPWNCTLTVLSGQLDATGTCTFTVREDTGTRTINLAVTAALGAQNVAASLDLNAGDLLQCYLSATSNVWDPLIWIEIAKRQ